MLNSAFLLFFDHRYMIYTMNSVIKLTDYSIFDTIKII